MVAVMLCAGSKDKARILWLTWVYSVVESSALCVVIWTVGVAWTDTLFAGGEWWIDAVLIFATLGATLKWLLLPTAVDEKWGDLLRGGENIKFLAERTKERSDAVSELLAEDRFADVVELLLFKQMELPMQELGSGSLKAMTMLPLPTISDENSNR